MKVIWLRCFWTDIMQRRVDWQDSLRPACYRGRTAYELRLGPLLIFVPRRTKFRDLFWLT